MDVPYSRKYWRELSLIVRPQIAIAKLLAELNDHTYNICKYKILMDFNLAVTKTECQTAKFNSPPIFWLYGIHDHDLKLSVQIL